MIVESTITGKRERAYLMPVLWVGTKDAFTIGPGEAELEWRLIEATDDELARLEAVGLVFAKDPVVPAPSSLSPVLAYHRQERSGSLRSKAPANPSDEPKEVDSRAKAVERAKLEGYVQGFADGKRRVANGEVPVAPIGRSPTACPQTS
jgi:hypothetical protein